MEPTNEAIIWAPSIQVVATILSVDLRKSKAADRPRLLMNEAAHFYHAAMDYFYHAAMDYFPMGRSTDWWRNQPSTKGATRADP